MAIPKGNKCGAKVAPEDWFVLKTLFFAKKIQKQVIFAFYKSSFSLKWEK